MKVLEFLFSILVSTATWAAPQPTHSAGLIVVYGGDRLIAANANFRGYDLGDGCGFSGIGPTMLGRRAWFSMSPLGPWYGGDDHSGCVSVDAVAREHAYDSIYVRREVAEVSWDMAAKLGFAYGAMGYVYFSVCPPPEPHGMGYAHMGEDPGWVPPQPYAPPLVIDYPPYEPHESFYPYQSQEPTC